MLSTLASWSLHTEETTPPPPVPIKTCMAKPLCSLFWRVIANIRTKRFHGNIYWSIHQPERTHSNPHKVGVLGIINNASEESSAPARKVWTATPQFPPRFYRCNNPQWPLINPVIGAAVSICQTVDIAAEGLKCAKRWYFAKQIQTEYPKTRNSCSRFAKNSTSVFAIITVLNDVSPGFIPVINCGEVNLKCISENAEQNMANTKLVISKCFCTTRYKWVILFWKVYFSNVCRRKENFCVNHGEISFYRWPRTMRSVTNTLVSLKG